MHYYRGTHPYYCGVDLHARTMHAHVLDADGQTVFEKDLPAEPAAFLKAIQPYRSTAERPGLVVGAECMFAWYWLADLCEDHGIPFLLGLVLLYEIDAITRFAEVGNFLSYARLVTPLRESGGKVKGVGCRKMGNAHLKWAFSEAASLMLRSFAPANGTRSERSANPDGRAAAKALTPPLWIGPRARTGVCGTTQKPLRAAGSASLSVQARALRVAPSVSAGPA